MIEIQFVDLLIRLGTAVVIGGSIGINRNLHRKPAGLRTLSLVALGSAIFVLSLTSGSDLSVDLNPVSRVIQGVIAGVGFIGAGVILHGAGRDKVTGLTTAAAIWVTAGLGVLCGLGHWNIIVISYVLIWIVLFFGAKVEIFANRYLGKKRQ